MKCENCNEEKSIIDIKNYVVRYESWEAYNCCCEECAKQRAMSDDIDEQEIIDIS